MPDLDEAHVAAYRMLGDAVRHSDDARALVARLARTLREPVALTDLRGNVLAVAPAAWRWPLEALRRWHPERADDPELEGISVEPVRLGDDVVALLCTRASPTASPAVEFAVRLIAADLERRNAEVAGRRELVGQVLDDVLRGVLGEREGARRLRGIGIDADATHRVLVGASAAGARALRSMPWNLHALMAGMDEPFARAVIGDRLVMVVAEGPVVAQLADTLLRRLEALGGDARVGVGGGYSGVAGVRLSHLEAQDVLALGPGIHEAAGLDLGRLLLVADLGLPLRELAERMLAPLREHDERHGARLVETLRAWFEVDCSVSEAAGRLFVHRNTVRYRLSLVESLAGVDLTSFATRMHFWVAIRSLDLGPLS